MAIATQFRGGSVVGVRLSTDEISVHIVVERLEVLQVATAVSDAVTAALAGSGERRPVVVTVDDIDLPDGSGAELGDRPTPQSDSTAAAPR